VLTADLVRAKVSRDHVTPRFVSVGDANLLAEAARLIALFEGHIGATMGEVNEALADHIGDSADFMVQRGLIKLIQDKAKIETVSALPPTEIRMAVFRAAAAHWPVVPGMGGEDGGRDAALAAASWELGITVEAVEAGLFADTKTEERLVSLTSYEPAVLLARYNLALAQAVLFRARQVTVQLPGITAARARQVFRTIKFHRLMYEAKKEPRIKGYVIVLDGPMSLFRQTSRYGLQMALFLSGLCLAERWELEAEVAWGKERKPKQMRLSDKTGLISHLADKGMWVSDEQRQLEKNWKKRALPLGWKLSRSARVVQLGQGQVLVPDYVIKHTDGREALLEIVWFWRKQAFKRRREHLAKHGPKNLILAVATRLNADQGDTDVGDATVYPFKGTILPKRIVSIAEAIAV
jgi:predicted nuclease of restriction endonuclease-like RecB superfamily